LTTLNRRLQYLCVLLITLYACAPRPVPALGQPGSPAIARTHVSMAEQESIPGDSSGLEEPTGNLTLRQALSLALTKSPELAGASLEIRIAEAKMLQAGLLPNPQFGVAVDQFGGAHTMKNFEAAETTLELSQLVELGGKRSKRIQLSTLEKDLAGWDYEVKRLVVLTETAKSFVEVLAAQEQEKVTSQLVELAQKVRESVSERVKAGIISPLEETKSAVSASSAMIEWNKAKNNLLAARYRLAEQWGQETVPAFGWAEGDLEEVRPIPSYDSVQGLIARNPDVARWVKEIQQRSAALELETAKRIPDITVRGGVIRFNEPEENAFLVGLSIPIPLFDRNQGGILAARRKLSKAKEEYRATKAKANSGLGEVYHTLSSSYYEVLSLKRDVLPAAAHAFEASREGFREGKFDFLELLDSQRTLFVARMKYIDALANHHKAKADLERLTGEGIDATLEKLKGRQNED
jgi:cobalt-zinc-cadmium efflux system outer membrane protein